MKVRWTNGSLRLRISPSELERLRAGTEIVERLGAPGDGEWKATCAVGGDTSVSIRAGDAVMTLSAADVERLAGDDVEGLYFSTAGLSPFRYFVEKNFPCAHPRHPEAAEVDSPATTFRAPDGFIERKLSSADMSANEISATPAPE